MKEEDIRNQEKHDTYLQLLKQDIRDIFGEEIRKFVSCPACGSWECQTEFNKWSFQYVTCCQCGTLFVNPRPQLDLLLNFYTESPSALYWVEHFFLPMVENRRKFLFKPLAGFFATNFPKFRNGVIGDIGAGFGVFLEELKTLWPNSETIAIEPSIEMSRICFQKGLKVISQPIEDVRNHEGYFDLLTCFELIEHLHDPEGFIEKVFSMLKIGGFFCLSTLNVHGFDIQVLWEQSKSISPPQHLNFFNTTSLSLLLERAGFIVEEVATPGRLDWDIVENMVNKNDAKVDRFWQIVIRKDESAKKELQRWISTHNLSSHMRIIAKKTK